MKKFIFMILVVMLFGQMVFGATYASFMRETGVDGTTIVINDQKQLEALQQGLIVNSGNIYYVDSTNGADNRSGKSWDLAVATLGQAQTLGAAARTAGTDKGRFIVYFREGHGETYTLSNTAPDLSSEGMILYSVGMGSEQAIFTFGTHSLTNDFDVTGDNITLINIRLLGAVEGLGGVIGNAPLDVGAANLRLIGCTFADTASLSTARWINADDTADGLELINCVNKSFSQTQTGGTVNVAFITFSGTRGAAISNVRLINNESNGAFSAGNIQVVNGSLTDALFQDNKLTNHYVTDGININLLDKTQNGQAINNWMKALGTAFTWISPDSMHATGAGFALMENYGSSLASPTSILTPSVTN